MKSTLPGTAPTPPRIAPALAALLLEPMLALGLASCSSEAAPGADAGSHDAALPDLCVFTPAQAWVVEAEELSVTIRCSSGAALVDLQLSALPDGATFDEASKTLHWTPTLDQAAVYTLPLAAPSLNATGALMIGVADAYDHPGNLPIQDPTLYSMELGLPVIFIASEPGSNDTFEPMQVTYRGQVLEAEAKLRGKSSTAYPKKSYALRFDKFSSFSETEFANFGNRRRVILTSTFDDNAYFRQRMAYDLWSSLNPSIPVQAYNAVVYRGTEYRGIYTVTDHINADHMKRVGLSEDANLYKAEDHDANFRTTDRYNDAKTSLHQGYSKTEGSPAEGEPDAFADLEALVDFVANADDATFHAGIADLVEIDDYVAWWLHVTFTLAYDTAGKNSYHYHDPVRTWRVAPWDFNSSFGQEWETSRAGFDDHENFFSRNLLFERLTTHPTIGPKIQERYRELLEGGAFSSERLDSMVARYMDEIGLSAARDWARWQDEYYSFDRWSSRGDFTTHLEEVEYVRTWIAGRWQFVHDNYLGEL
jgi:spore coat protein H